MQELTFKILLQKKGTASAIIAIALLVALLASVNALVNNINSQTTIITKLASPGDTYLLTSKGSTSISDSKLPTNLIDLLKNNSDVSYASAQQIVAATVKTDSRSYTVTVRGVDNIQTFLTNEGVSTDGALSGENQASIGIVLSKLIAVSKNDLLNLTINQQPVQLNVTAVTQANKQSDTQITLPLSTLQGITQEKSQISIIEFRLKNPSETKRIIGDLIQTLPPNTKITSLQQVTTFAEDINIQTATFINVWSIAIYLVVVAASYVIASRAVNDAQFELYTLRTIGAKRKTTLNLIIAYALTIGLIGSIIGVSLGIVGTQSIATYLRINWGNQLLSPILDVNQALEIILLAIASSFIGCLYPAIKGSKIRAKETTL